MTGEREDGAAQGPPIEVGWLVVGRLDPVDREAVHAARRRLYARLRETFPRFDWQMPILERRDLAQAHREEPVKLLDHGLAERDSKHWDFSIVVTGADLESHYKPFALGVPSRGMGVAVISTARIDPQATGEEATQEERRETLTRRLVALALHLFGDLNGLEHGDEPAQAMFPPRTVEDLDGMAGYSPQHTEQLAAVLAAVADLRLEEIHGTRPSAWAFYLRAGRVGLGDIASAVRQAQPWLFPLRLSRLTTAAASAMVVLLISAEAWDLGMSQRPALVVGLSLATLVATTVYILVRQRLLVRRGGRALTEQGVVTNVSISLVVLLGLAITYTGLFLATLLLAWVLFPGALVGQWAASLEGAVAPGHYLVLAGFVAALGLLIGALGASFEQEIYFRHIAYVDEET